MPKTFGNGKRRPLNMRTTPALRAKIEQAAEESGRSLVQEVEYRLERSFWEEEAWRITSSGQRSLDRKPLS